MTVGQAYDFLIIGTIKGGTTTLHYLLADHPQIVMPAGKEAPLFLRDVDEADVAAHVAHHVGNSKDAVRGKATPLYMCLPNIAPRIHRAMPDTKLIAILREPVSRARSHWKMRSRFGVENRSFEQVVHEQLADLERWRQTGIEEDGYVASGEYGRILAEYSEYFPPAQILVVEADALRQDPMAIVQRVCAFLELPAHQPRDLGRDFNVAERPGRRARIERALWDRLPHAAVSRRVSPATQQRLGKILDKYGVSRPGISSDETLSDELTQRLVAHYAEDAARMPSEFHDIDVWLNRST